MERKPVADDLENGFGDLHPAMDMFVGRQTLGPQEEMVLVGKNRDGEGLVFRLDQGFHEGVQVLIQSHLLIGAAEDREGDIGITGRDTDLQIADRTVDVLLLTRGLPWQQACKYQNE